MLSAQGRRDARRLLERRGHRAATARRHADDHPGRPSSACRLRRAGAGRQLRQARTTAEERPAPVHLGHGRAAPTARRKDPAKAAEALRKANKRPLAQAARRQRQGDDSGAVPRGTRRPGATLDPASGATTAPGCARTADRGSARRASASASLQRGSLRPARGRRPVERSSPPAPRRELAAEQVHVDQERARRDDAALDFLAALAPATQARGASVTARVVISTAAPAREAPGATATWRGRHRPPAGSGRRGSSARTGAAAGTGTPKLRRSLIASLDMNGEL